MAHQCDFEDRIEIEYDWETERQFLVRTVRADWNDKKNKQLKQLDVYKEYESGTYYEENRFFARNIVSTMMGYLVFYPGEKRIIETGYYYGGENKPGNEPEDWQIYGTERIGGCYPDNKTSDRDIENVLKVYPKFKYIINKINRDDLNNPLLMDIIEVYKQHPEVEGLCQLGLYRIALNKQLYKLSLPKRKQVIKFIMEHHEEMNKWTTLRSIQACIKYKSNLAIYQKYQNIWWKRTFEEYLYLTKKGYIQYETKNAGSMSYEKETSESVNQRRLYDDYLDMCKKVGHNLKDPYWHFPSDLNKAHAKVMEELKNVRATASKLKGEYLKAVMQPMIKFNGQVNGYDIFIPDDIETIQKQCDDLYQCLIRNGYVEKVLMQDEILVFIWKDGKPVATAEVFYNGKLGQFYGDESGHARGESCLPNEECQAAFKEWFSNFKPIKVKAPKRNIHYYKGFYEKISDNEFKGYANYRFEVGKTYATKFSDEEINVLGGIKCNATDKVFHFCESISEISRHYNPTCYCEIEPLGAVVEHDGALLSNRIKILRFIPAEEVTKIQQQEARSII